MRQHFTSDVVIVSPDAGGVERRLDAGVRPDGKFVPQLVLLARGGANATVLGNITVGEGAKIGAGSVVLEPVPAHCTVVVPATGAKGVTTLQVSGDVGPRTEVEPRRSYSL